MECGIRGFLIADRGLLALLTEMQAAGELPGDIVWKISVMMAPSNPLGLRELETLGASTANVPSDVTVEQLAELRAATPLPIDLYVESPDALGGVVRGNELGDLIQAGAPLYAKFGLRNARMIYPAGRAPRRRGLRDRAGEGAPGGGRPRVARPPRARASSSRGRGPRDSASRNSRHDRRSR